MFKKNNCLRLIQNMNVELIKIVKQGGTDDLEDIFERHRINRECYTWFLWDNIDLSYIASDGMTAFKWTILKDHLNTLEKLLSLASSHKLLSEPKVRRSIDEALFTACKNDNLAAAKLLLQYGADADVIVDDDSALTISFRPQYVTCINSKDFCEKIYELNTNAVELVKLLMQHKANPEIILPNGRDAISVSQNWRGWSNPDITKLLR